MSPISTRIDCVPNLVAVRRSCRKEGGGGVTDRRETKGNCRLILVDLCITKKCHNVHGFTEIINARRRGRSV